MPCDKSKVFHLVETMLDARVEHFPDLEQHAAEAHGPVLVLGDLNTQIKYRRREEKVLGPYLYTHVHQPLISLAIQGKANVRDLGIELKEIKAQVRMFH